MDRIQKIKYKRLTPAERYIFDILNNPDMIISDEDIIIDYILNNINIISYNTITKTYYVISDEIWSELRQRYMVDGQDVQKLITKINGNI
jgi:hypothetical protein